MIFIRADANENIGTGHVMRCLSLADAFLSFGEDVIFVTADHRGDELIEKRGYSTICLDSDWTQMDSEIVSLNAVINQANPNILVIDSYYVTAEYFNKLHPLVKLAYFDDMNSGKWDVDFLINYNVFAGSMDYSQYSETNTELLLGPEYAPLREEFKGMPSHLIKKNPIDVLVSAGGADPQMITETLLEKVCPEFADIRFHFIVGALNPRLDKIKEIAGDNVILHINEQHMSDLMNRCDVAISAAGTTLYELCACGIPTITYTLADNQIIAAEEFDKQGIMINAGDSRSDADFVDSVKFHLSHLIKEENKRGAYSYKMQELVDGNGAMRIATRLIDKWI